MTTWTRIDHDPSTGYELWRGEHGSNIRSEVWPLAYGPWSGVTWREDAAGVVMGRVRRLGIFPDQAQAADAAKAEAERIAARESAEVNQGE